MNCLQRATSVAGLFGCLFLAACSSIPETKTDQSARLALYESRYNELLSLDQWVLDGRLAVNDGQDGGSGHINWQRHGETSHMNFHGALGRGAWRLDADRDGAILELADGEIYRAPSLSQLVEQKIGWEVPVDALSWWVRGFAAPGDWDLREFDEHGRLMSLSQFGWVIEYGSYADAAGIFMPRKLTARRDSYTVKFAVREWSLGADADRDD